MRDVEIYHGYLLVQLDDLWTVIREGFKFGQYPELAQAKDKVDFLINRRRELLDEITP